jgi:hypothetical protein
MLVADGGGAPRSLLSHDGSGSRSSAESLRSRSIPAATNEENEKP